MVQKAFRESIRVIHPDVAMCVGLSSDEVQMAGELAKKLTGARETIFAFYRGFGAAHAQ